MRFKLKLGNRFFLLLLYAVFVESNRPPRFGFKEENVVIRLKEGPETPVGSKILDLIGYDDDGDDLTFGVLEDAFGLVRIENEGNNRGSVVLSRELDAEIREEYTVVLTLTDNKLGEGNFITRSVLILVEDINDNSPIFLPYSPTFSVEEHSKIPLEISRIRAHDRDSGIFGQVIFTLKEESGAEDYFEIKVESPGVGIIRLVKELDYERKFLYQLKILASDRGRFGSPVNTATAAILLRVIDIPDQPPEFVSAPSVTRISEDVPKFTEILRLKAVDGDRGIDDPIKYAILDGRTDLFAVNSETGIVFTKNDVDREASSDGTFILRIKAFESDGSDAETEITIIIEDVNDEIPKFKSQVYMAEISENSQKNTPVTFFGENILPEVVDGDRGINGTFELFLEGDKGAFEVSPSQGINEANFVIKVKNPILLDYERIKVINFTVVAKEIQKTENLSRSSSANVIVHIRDQNDNFPEFEKKRYSVSISEDLKPGETIAQIRATDEDSGLFGSYGIRYTSLSGPLADNLYLNPTSGLITMLEGPSTPFDRERVKVHYLTVEARDDQGAGNRNTVELVINVRDVNDNPPTFDQPYYEAYLPENAPKFAVPFSVKATDPDESENGRIRYRILRGKNFTIDPKNGEINPVGRIDFENILPLKNTVKAINLTIRAYDLGVPSLYEDVDVSVYITDVNDMEPVFEKPIYRVTLREDVRGGTKVIQVKARDEDGTAPNNIVAYRISSGAKDKFVIDVDNGIISVSEGANLDPDLTSPSKISSYFLEVLAIDGGLGKNKLSGSCMVNVSISDINNKPPVFELKNNEEIRTLENVNIGHFLTRISAVDPDTNAKLRFSIEDSKSFSLDENGDSVKFNSSLFDLNPVTGDLRVKERLDRETVEEFKIALKVYDVAARDKSPERSLENAQEDHTTITILVEDVNDNSPIFEKPVYSVSLTENSPEGSKIITVKAKDPDKNKTISYMFEPDEENDLQTAKQFLSLNQESGLISVRNPVDAERIRWLNFTVKAMDNGFPVKYGLTKVFISILDLNDNTPQFEEPVITNITVREDAPLGTIVAKIRAHDADVSPEFGKITYFLDRTSALGKFRLDPDSGELTTSEKLNREETEFFNLIIQAYDNYQFGFTTGDSRHVFMQLRVQISDVNDEAPVFQEVLEDCALITEFHEMSESIFTIRAQDKDNPETPNGKLSFEIKNGNQLDFFRLKSFKSYAKVYPNKSLKGHYGNYSLLVRVSDQGHPPNFNEVRYNVCVQDFNDNAPIFIQPPSNFTLRIPENMTVGSEVIQVRAVDTDIGSNGAVRYRIRKDASGFYETFSIDAVSGVIKLQRALDRERQKIYEIRVEAFDLGIPTSLQSDLDLTIFVRNVNDHEPQFLIDQFIANFTESKLPGQERVKIVDTVDRDDEDVDSGEVCYFIVGGKDKDLFDLHPTQHELMTMKVLDREMSAELEIIIRATEECFNPPSEVEYFDSNDDTLLIVKVFVNDINDNPPRFNKQTFTGGIASDREFGYAFMTVSAEDPDSNSKLSYSISGSINHSSDSVGLEGVHKPEFIINSTTGEILINFDVQKEMKGHFRFNVIVNDGKRAQTHSDTAEVLVYLFRPDQRVKFVVRSRPGEIRSRINEFRTVLSNVTGAIINVDALRVHKEKSGGYDKTKTDILLHFVNPTENKVIDVAKVFRLIDYRTEELDPIFKDFNVLHTDEVNAEYSFQRSSPGPEKKAIFFMVGILGFALLILVITICVCVRQRQKFRRRLKAATTSSESSVHPSSNPPKKREIVPNTNLHASEGSNPIWLASMGYDNYEYEENEYEDERNIEENHNEEPSTVGTAQKTDSPHHSESSSGLGSGSSRKLTNARNLAGGGSSIASSSTFRNRNLSIAALFPPTMPPVEKLNNTLVNFGVTTYDEDDIPRTEL